MTTKAKPEVKPSKMVLRGALVSCPRCGGRKLFQHWFKLKDRCPTCGYQIDREKNGGFFLGGYVMNFILGEGLLSIFLFVFATRVIADPEMAIKNWMIFGFLLAIIPPVLFFPVSRTTWMAVDLMIHPMQPDELADAAAHAA